MQSSIIVLKIDVYGKRQTARRSFWFYNSIIIAFTPVLKYVKLVKLVLFSNDLRKQINH
jgi:hypothetical protein